jgi:hypothetical protein
MLTGRVSLFIYIFFLHIGKKIERNWQDAGKMPSIIISK